MASKEIPVLTGHEMRCSFEGISFFRLQKNAVIKEQDNDFVLIEGEQRIVDFGVSQSWISEDLVTIEHRAAGQTTAHMITSGGEEMKITGVSLLQCSNKNVSTIVNCLITPDLINSIVLSYRDSISMGIFRVESTSVIL